MHDKSNDVAETSVNNCGKKLTKWCRARMINPLRVQMSAAPWSKMSSRRTVCHLERRPCHLVVSPAVARCAISRREAVKMLGMALAITVDPINPLTVETLERSQLPLFTFKLTPAILIPHWC